MKKVVAVILTDTHLTEDNIESNKSVFKQARQIASDNGLKVVHHAGDIFHSRKGQPQDILDAFTNILDDYKTRDFVLKLIPGNHDKQDYKSAISYLTPYREHAALQLHELAAVELETEPFIMAYMPFFADEQYINNFWLKDIDWMGKKKVLITHIGVNGAVMNNGVAVKSKITPELFEAFDLVLIGHYHDPQAINSKIKYIGASIQHNYGERLDKGVTLLYDDLSIETIELDFPRYRNYEVDVTKLNLQDIEDLKQEKQNSGDEIRITLIGDEKDVSAYDSQRLKEIGVDVKKKKKKIVAEEIEQRVEAHTDLSLISSFERFCEKNNLSYNKGIKYLKLALNVQTEEIED